eukprot:TRINITY_DN57612_c0_g1_i1.p1 TRINITY_DN57612_c0_g1~~TRINITY_DN57612_c0_g1_i1.p1  ORF type:complete len:414 (-),score=44.82 TRINITY_DN57612_c0_g1_i1:1573-2814(-)
MSFFEIYNDKIYDSFSKEYSKLSQPLDIKEDSSGTPHIPGLIRYKIESKEEAFVYLSVAVKNRFTGSSCSNVRSSRSHSIFQITLEQGKKIGKNKLQTFSSQFRVVDLAGSERSSPNLLMTRDKEKRAELTSINTSLLILGQCITALGEAHPKYVPYRRSKLTRLLKDSLEGNSKMLLYICISSSIDCAHETMQSLQFGHKAMQVKHIKPPAQMQPVINTENSDLERLRIAYEKEREIRHQLQEFISQHNMAGMKAELEEAKKQNVELSNKMKELESVLEAQQQRETKHVRFRSRVLNEDSLDSEQRERIEHNLRYKDDAIFENISIFKELREPQHPYEYYFREPENLNAGHTLLMENSPEHSPRGKFAKLNNSLTLQHSMVTPEQAPGADPCTLVSTQSTWVSSRGLFRSYH